MLLTYKENSSSRDYLQKRGEPMLTRLPYVSDFCTSSVAQLIQAVKDRRNFTGVLIPQVDTVPE